MFFIRYIVTFIFLLAYLINAEAQFITFTAKDSKSQYAIILDSIKIQNITKNRDTVLKGIQSIDLSLISDVHEQSNNNLKSLLISQNYPNEFNNETRFNVYIPTSTILKLTLIDLLGYKYIESDFYIEQGRNTFRLNGSGLKNGIYFLTVQTDNDKKCLKIIKIGNNNNTDVYFELLNSSYQLPNKLCKAIIAQTDIFNFVGYSKTYKLSVMNDITPVDSQNYEFEMIQYEPNIKYNSGTITIRNFWSKEIYEETTRYNRWDSLVYNRKDTTVKIVDSVIVSMDKRLLVELDSFSIPFARCDSSIFYSDSLVFCLESGWSGYIGDVTYGRNDYINCSIYVDTLNNNLSFFLYESNTNFYLNGIDAGGKSKDFALKSYNIPFIIDTSNVLTAEIIATDLISLITKFTIYNIDRVTNIQNDITIQKINILDGINQVDDKSILILKLYP